MARQWRCFFCDEVFKRREDAAQHFGVFDSFEAEVPACKIKEHEGHLVKYIRKLEAQVRRHMHEDSDVLRSIMALEGSHEEALIEAEEHGFARGIEDTVPVLREVAEWWISLPPGLRQDIEGSGAVPGVIARVLKIVGPIEARMEVRAGIGTGS